VCAFFGGKAFELIRTLFVNGFWLQKETEEGCGTGQGGLQPEDVAPGTECYDYAADEGAEGGADEGAAEEPA